MMLRYFMKDYLGGNRNKEREGREEQVHRSLAFGSHHCGQEVWTVGFLLSRTVWRRRKNYAEIASSSEYYKITKSV